MKQTYKVVNDTFNVSVLVLRSDTGLPLSGGMNDSVTADSSS